jgi:hypothetical protein
MLCTVGALIVREWVQLVNLKLDAIENYLTSHPIPQLVLPEGAPQSHRERGHKGEISKPDQWKV